MKTYVFRSNRHEPMTLAGRILRGHCWLELTEQEVASLSEDERAEATRARSRRELFVHPLSDGRHIEAVPGGALEIGVPPKTEPLAEEGLE